jgi:hypothetical protein
MGIALIKMLTFELKSMRSIHPYVGYATHIYLSRGQRTRRRNVRANPACPVDARYFFHTAQSVRSLRRRLAKQIVSCDFLLFL